MFHHLALVVAVMMAKRVPASVMMTGNLTTPPAKMHQLIVALKVGHLMPAVPVAEMLADKEFAQSQNGIVVILKN